METNEVIVAEVVVPDAIDSAVPDEAIAKPDEVAPETKTETVNADTELFYDDGNGLTLTKEDYDSLSAEHKAIVDSQLAEQKEAEEQEFKRQQKEFYANSVKKEPAVDENAEILKQYTPEQIEGFKKLQKALGYVDQTEIEGIKRQAMVDRENEEKETIARGFLQKNPIFSPEKDKDGVMRRMLQKKLEAYNWQDKRYLATALEKASRDVILDLKPKGSAQAKANVQVAAIGSNKIVEQKPVTPTATDDEEKYGYKLSDDPETRAHQERILAAFN